MTFGSVVPRRAVPVLAKKDTFMESYRISSGYVTTRQSDAIHYHNYFQIWYTVSGTYEHIINGKTYVCSPGSVALVMPFAAHALNTTETDIDNALIVSVSFPGNVFYNKKIPMFPLTYQNMAYDGKLLPVYVKLDGEDKVAADALITDIMLEYRKKSDMFITSVFGRTDALMKLIAKRQTERITKKKVTSYMHINKYVNDAVLDIEDNFRKKLVIDEAADKYRFSRKAFTNNFKKITGRGYHDVILGKRLMEAVDLLRFSRKSMSEIAEECGFSSSAHFSKACDTVFGVSPLELQRAMIIRAREEAEILKSMDADNEWARVLDLETVKEHRNLSLGKRDW